MGETVSADTAVERGRYAIHTPDDGSWVVARQVNLCESCLTCGCGDAADPLVAPAALVKMAPMFGRMAEGGGLAGRLKALMRMGGDGDDGPGPG